MYLQTYKLNERTVVLIDMLKNHFNDMDITESKVVMMALERYAIKILGEERVKEIKKDL